MSVDRTMFAAEAFSFADRFHTCFIRSQIEGFELFLTAPEGQSTGGGIQAVQHITLKDVITNHAIVLGSAHGLNKTVEIRSYGSLARSFAKRFPGAPFPVPQEEHDDLVTAFVKFFEMLKFEVDLEEESKGSEAEIASSSLLRADSGSTQRPSPGPSPRPSPAPSSNAEMQRDPRVPRSAWGTRQARKAPPPFSLTEFLSNLPRAYYLVALALFLVTLVIYGLSFGS